jgi:4-hydroxy-L-threonine phosphate dehydrogenase PdxA
VNYANDPARANAVIVDAVETADSFWVYTAELAEWSVAKQIELGLVGNGPDGTIGNMETDRIQKVIDDLRTAGLEVPDDLTAEDMFTNEFIDDSIGL